LGPNENPSAQFFPPFDSDFDQTYVVVIKNMNTRHTVAVALLQVCDLLVSELSDTYQVVDILTQLILQNHNQLIRSFSGMQKLYQLLMPLKMVSRIFDHFKES